MQHDPRVSPWASRFVGPEEGDGQPEPVNVTRSNWAREKKRAAIATRNRHLRHLRNRLFNTIPAALFLCTPSLGWFWTLAVWAVLVANLVAVGISAFEALFAQAASAISVETD